MGCVSCPSVGPTPTQTEEPPDSASLAMVFALDLLPSHRPIPGVRCWLRITGGGSHVTVPTKEGRAAWGIVGKPRLPSPGLAALGAAATCQGVQTSAPVRSLGGY